MAKVKKPGTGKGQHPKAKLGSSKEEVENRKVTFAKAFLANGGNARQAAITAKYSLKSVDAQASRLLKDAKVQEILKAERARALTAADITVERVLREVGRIAFADTRKLFKADGTMVPVRDLDDDTAASLASVEVDEIKAGGAVIGNTHKIKMWDKGAALEKLMKHLGLYEKDNSQKGDALAELLNKVDGSVLRPAGAAG